MNLAAGHWPEGSALGWPDPPQNLMPGRIYSWPSGTQRVANRAERLLSQAVAYWDASKYRNGDRFLRNQGVAGELLDLRLGSSVVANTNDPLFLAPDATGYVYLPGLANNWMNVPDSASLDVTGDIDIRLLACMDTWESTGGHTLAKRASPTTDYAYWLGITTGKTLQLGYTSDGTTAVLSTASAAIPFAAGETGWVRATRSSSTGDVNFYTSADGVTWTQLGVTRTTTPSAIWASATVLGIGASVLGSPGPAGRYYRVQIYGSLDGTDLRLDADCSVIASGSATSFTATTGQTVTINRSTSGRKSVAMPNKTVKKIDDGHVYLPGVASNFLSVPDESALDITGDIDIRVRVALDDWTPAASQLLLNKNLVTGNQQSYALYVHTTNARPRFGWSADGATGMEAIATASPNVTDGAPLWLRVTLDVDNGASGYDVKFYTSDDGTTWTQLGATVTGGTPTSIFASTSDLRLGVSGTNTLPATGRLYRAQVYNGINGTLVLDVDTSKASTSWTAGTSGSFTALTGQTVTLNSTSASGMQVVPVRWGAGRPLFLFGTDDYMTAVDNWQHTLLNFTQNDSFTVLWVGRMPSVTSSQYILGKRNTVGNGPGIVGWGLRTSGVAVGVIDDGVNAVNRQPAISTLTLNTLIFRRNTAIKTFASDTPDTGSSTTDTTASLVTTEPFQIGARGGSQSACDMEFVASVIFRRALSNAEIKTLFDYFTNPYPGFEGNTDTSALDILSSGVFWIDANRSGIV